MSASIPPTDRAWSEIDLAALVRNALAVSRSSGRPLLPMVKANGYGLGAVEVARALEAANPWGYGVATVSEGSALRRAGISRPIIVFTPLVRDSVEDLAAAELRPVVGDLTGLRRWLDTVNLPFHLEVDTGMGRAGVRWDDRELDELLAAAAASESWEGIFTHFESAEEQASRVRQEERFAAVLESLPRRPPLVHAANSAAAMVAESVFDLVRPGIFLYGGAVAGHNPEPVVRFCAPVVGLRRVEPGDGVSYGATWRAERPTLVATVGAGYADGVLRSLSNRGSVELAGQLCPIVGNVTMDMTMVAAPESVALGDTATFYGGAISLDVQAAAAGTISYELLTSLGPRVTRRYQGLEER